MQILLFFSLFIATFNVGGNDALNKGITAYNAKQYPEAVSFFTEAIATTPTAKCYYYRAMSQMQLQHYSDANTDFSKVIAEPTQNYPDAWYYRA